MSNPHLNYGAVTRMKITVSDVYYHHQHET